jgi:hypothetical protein
MTASISSLVGGCTGREGGGIDGSRGTVADEGLEDDWTIL